MEIKREQLAGTGAPLDFRARQLQARDMLRGDLEGEALERYVKESVLTTTVEKAVAWSQGNSIWPLTFGLACCAIEMMSIVGARVDVARFGWEAFWASPRQADLLILSGRVSVKMAPVIRRIDDQMLELRWAISMGACCSSMGVFNNYALVPADKFLPIDGTCPAARRGPRLCCTASCACARRSMAPSATGGVSAMTRWAPRRCPPTAPAPVTARSMCSREGTQPVPDATGLEKTANALRDDNAESILGTDFGRGDRAVLLVDPAHVIHVLSSLKDQGYGFRASLHGVDYYPDEPRLGLLMSCWT